MDIGNILNAVVGAAGLTCISLGIYFQWKSHQQFVESVKYDGIGSYNRRRDDSNYRPPASEEVPTITEEEAP